jgi:multidrug efflux pump subunit AcrB
MSIAGFAVRQWQFTLVAFFALALAGISALFSIPKAEDPAFRAPATQIILVAPGFDPAAMEELIADPIEDALSGLDDVKEINSTSQDGLAIVFVEFTWGKVDPDQKYDEVVREVNALRPQLPEAITRLQFRRVSPGLTNIMQAAVVSDSLSWRDLERQGRLLRDAIDRSPGVRDAEIWGAPRSEIRIGLDLAKLAALGIPVTRVADALQNQGAELPAGAVHQGARRFNVMTATGFETLEEVASTVVLSAEGRTVRVRDVAEVGWATQEATHLTRFNGKRAVFVTANQLDGGNIFDVRRGLDATLDAFEARLPPGVTLERGFDQAENVKNRLSKLGRDFAIALGLVLITLIPLGFRASLVVAVSIPLSLAIGVSLMQGLGYSLNQLTIAGAVLALGLLVDDSIVVTENIARRLREGLTPVQAAVEGTNEITAAVLGCTATLMLAFVPLLFLPEGSGQFIRSLPVSVLSIVGASLLVSLTVIPFLASRLLKPDAHEGGNAVLRWLMDKIHTVYRPILHIALERPLVTLVSALVLSLASLALVPKIGFSLFPPADTPQFIIQIETPEGTALSETNKALAFVEARLAEEKDIDWSMANLGRGNPRIFYNVTQQEQRANIAAVFVQLKKWEPGESPKLLDRLRADFATYPGAEILVRVFENGPAIEAPVAIRVTGDDLNELTRLAREVEATLSATPGVRNIRNPLRLERTDLDIGIDADKAAALGVPAGAAERTVALALSGLEVGGYRDADGERFPVVVRLPFGERHELSSLDRIYLPTAGGAAPLAQIATPRFEASPAQITRYQRVRSVTVTAYTQTGFLTSAVTADAAERLKSISVPPGYQLGLGGQAEAQGASFAGLSNAILLAVFGILAVLVLEFRSFASTAVVATVIPLGVLGGMIALFLSGYSLSFTAVIGFIALIGIEIKNSILLVDFTNQLRREGVGLKEAVERAGEIRFLPVLLTSATAIGGLTPLVLEQSGLYSPLAIVIIGGLIASTLLSRFVTPAAYLLLAPKDEAFRASHA